jgi:glycosyltransferase involved in cell wall biosynthesis
LRVGVFYRLYSDGRKREQVLGACLRELGLSNFELFIMGSGWESEISRLRSQGLAVSYASVFDSATYLAWLDVVDVVLVTGRDEGAVSFLDALAVGKRIIVSRIGYHADYEHELVVYANSTRDFTKALRVDLLRQQTAYELVSGTNWRRYALEHLMLWSRAG